MYERLIEEQVGIDKNKKSDFELLLLSEACRTNHADTVLELLNDACPTINLTESLIQKLLVDAASEGFVAVVELLLKAADNYQISIDLKTALNSAQKKGHANIVAIITEQQFKNSSSFLSRFMGFWKTHKTDIEQLTIRK